MKFVTINGDTAIIKVSGRFNLIQTAEMMPEVTQAFGVGVIRICVDFGETTYIDSCAIRDLVKLYRRVKPENFEARNAKGDVYAALYAAKLDELWHLPDPR